MPYPPVLRRGFVVPRTLRSNASRVDASSIPSGNCPARSRLISAARRTDALMFWYPVQRQRFPAIASVASSRVGLGFSSRNAAMVVTNPGVAESALQTVTILERLLNRMQSAVRLDEAFDGGDRSTFEAGREDETGSNRLSVEQHGARTTHAVFTTHVRARLTEVVTNGIRSQSAGGKNDGARHLVERERHGHMVLTGVCCQLGQVDHRWSDRFWTLSPLSCQYCVLTESIRCRREADPRGERGHQLRAVRRRPVNVCLGIYLRAGAFPEGAPPRVPLIRRRRPRQYVRVVHDLSQLSGGHVRHVRFGHQTVDHANPCDDTDQCVVTVTARDLVDGGSHAGFGGGHRHRHRDLV